MELDRLFAEPPAFADGDIFALRVEGRLDRGWTFRQFLIGGLGIAGGLILGAQILGSGLATRLGAVVEEEGSFYKIIQSVLVAHLHGNAAQISVEIGRGSIPSEAQPSFLQMEEALNNIPNEA